MRVLSDAAGAGPSRIVREDVANKDHAHIQAVVKLLVEDFAYSLNSNSRKGGLIGLAAVAVALGQAHAPPCDH
jgi:vacuole morphology and inheritance protein 14